MNETVAVGIKIFRLMFEITTSVIACHFQHSKAIPSDLH